MAPSGLAPRQVAELVDPDAQWLARFAGAAMHDLRSPLRGIILELDLAREHTHGADAVESHLDAVEAHAWRVHGMLNDLLALTRLESEGEPVRVALQPVVEQVLANLAQEGHATGSVDLEPLPHVLGHKALLEHALHCLLGSVLPVGGDRPPRIRIDAHTEQGTCRLEVAVQDQIVGQDPFGLHENGDFRRVVCTRILHALGGRVGHEVRGGATVYRLMLPLP